MSAQDSISREKRIRGMAEVIYAENKKKGLPSDPARDWKQAEETYDDKITYFFFWKPGQFLRKYYYKLIAVVVLLIVFLALANLKVGQDLKDMRDRPYLMVDLINPMQISDTDSSDTYYGNYLIFKNSGKTPASNVKISYYMTTEVDGKVDGKRTLGQRWFDQKAEGISTLGFVAPGGFIKEPSFRSLSPAASYYYFEAIASYHGLNPAKHYWTHIKRIFKIDRETGTLIPVFSYAEWDNGKNFVVPALSTDKNIWNLLAKAEKR